VTIIVGRDEIRVWIVVMMGRIIIGTIMDRDEVEPFGEDVGIAVTWVTHS